MDDAREEAVRDVVGGNVAHEVRAYDTRVAVGGGCGTAKNGS